jgi:hypothetical protein
MRARTPTAALFLCAIVLAASLACHEATDPLQSDKYATVDASIAFLNLEGGCWTIELSPTVHYLPLHLPDEFRRDGLKIRADLFRRDDYASFCMVGPVVQILSIHAR